MNALKEKVSDKLFRLFTDSSPSSSSEASPYAKESKPLSSYFSHMLKRVNLDGSKTSKHQDDLGYDYHRFEPQEDYFDTYLDFSPMSKCKDLMKDKIDDEGQDSMRSSNSSEVFEEANVLPNTSKKPAINLTDNSSFISPELYEFLESSLPNIVKGCQWVLLYSTLKHGISLRTLIRKSAELSGPGLLILGDKQGAVFGGLLGCPLKPTAQRKYQGTNQTFVFTTIYGSPRLFRPTGANRYYYMCLNDFLALGGGGNFAIRINEDLLTGTSGPCDTFGNSCLAHSPEFDLKNVELWGFTHSSQLMQS
ncbi:hypothetical protein L6164_012972 [Bauhinia variegata]|uniref:Uncharacterized protein n=1 Tax=Bauhinia variegata TaxID=167791 RepID=A0ACB9PBM9_BAUVA|nr:hypothetical protein L6164_012972 [Bauhinia variegata]